MRTFTTLLDPLLNPFTEAEDEEDLVVGTRPPPVAPIAHRAPGTTWKWVARITGTHSHYRFEREFLARERGEWVLDSSVYEVCEPDGTREFVMTTGRGHLIELDQSDVDRLFRPSSEETNYGRY